MAAAQAVVTTGKLGIIEALDRTTGEWLWAQGDGPAERRRRDRPEDRRRRRSTEAAIPHIGETTVNCPADPGGRGWPATAYSPRTQMLYLPLNEFCSNTTPTPLDPGQAYTGGGRAIFARALVPGQRRQHRPHRRGQADRPDGSVVAAHPRAGDRRSAADRRRSSSSPGPGTACSAPMTTPPAKCCGR